MRSKRRRRGVALRQKSTIISKMRFHVITIFPNILDSYLSESLMRRALKSKLIQVAIHNLRDFAPGKRTKGNPAQMPFRRVDDKPFGGGPGMVLQVEPIYRAVQHINSKIKTQSLKVKNKKVKVRTILFSTRGKKFDSKAAQRLTKYDELIFICGRYEGVDERVAEHIADEELSMGDYVLSGGELPALVAIEAISRFIPGFLGKHESLEEIKGSYPVFTRPPEFSPKKMSRKKWKVPPVLLSGNHKRIAEWRKEKGR